MDIWSKLRKVNRLYILKTGIGSTIAILLAAGLGFSYSPSAGIITLLTIQNTKKETITIALRRFVAFLVALVLCNLLYRSIGYTPIAFGAFVLFFVAICLLFELKDGIAMNAVLMTHFLVEKRMDLPLLLNELGLLVIGMGIGIVLNLVMPKNKEKIRKEQRLLEIVIKETLYGLADLLKEKEACLIQNQHKLTRNNSEETRNKACVDFILIETKVDTLLKSAYEEAGNTLLTDTRYLVSYLEMRKLQIGVLKEVKDNIESIPVVLQQTFPISDFIGHIADSFHERNNVLLLMKELEELKQHYRKELLPQSREEFEYRAVLFQILKELEYFLKLKQSFIQDLKEKNMDAYWNEE